MRPKSEWLPRPSYYTNLRVGRSNRSGRAIRINGLRHDQVCQSAQKISLGRVWADNVQTAFVVAPVSRQQQAMKNAWRRHGAAVNGLAIRKSTEALSSATSTSAIAAGGVKFNDGIEVAPPR